MQYLLLLAVLILGVMFLIVKALRNGSDNVLDVSLYRRKKYIFDSNSEFALYKMLDELFGNQYHIFVQVNYSHLIEPDVSDKIEERKLRNKIDKKSADFVLCHKDTVVPLLIIELDGYTHNYRSRIARDEFINEITKIANLPIVHIKTADANREYVKRAVEEKLGAPELTAGAE